MQGLDRLGQRQVQEWLGQIRLKTCPRPGQGQNRTRPVTTGRLGAMTGPESAGAAGPESNHGKHKYREGTGYHMAKTRIG